MGSYFGFVGSVAREAHNETLTYVGSRLRWYLLVTALVLVAQWFLLKAQDQLRATTMVFAVASPRAWAGSSSGK